MKIFCILKYLVTHRFYLIHGKPEETVIICLELYYASVFQNIKTAFQSVSVCKSPLVVSVLGPWIGKIKIYSVQFPFFEKIVQTINISAEKCNIAEVSRVRLLQSSQKHIQLSLNCNVHIIRIVRSLPGYKLALSASDFKLKTSRKAKGFSPSSFQFLRIVKEVL